MRPLTLFLLVVGVACLVTANEEEGAAAADETPVEPEEDHQTLTHNSTEVQQPEAGQGAEREEEPTPQPGAAPDTANGDNNGARLLTSSLLVVLSLATLHAVLV